MPGPGMPLSRFSGHRVAASPCEKCLGLGLGGARKITLVGKIKLTYIIKMNPKTDKPKVPSPGAGLSLDELGTEVLDAAIYVHRQLGPGLLESVYTACLHAELVSRGLKTEREVPVRIRYNDAVLEDAFRVDLIVEGKLLLEIKAVELLQPIHSAQAITYLRLAGLDLAYVLNFNVPLLKDGIRRILSPELYARLQDKQNAMSPSRKPAAAR